MLPSSYLRISTLPRTCTCSVPTLAVSSPLRLEALLSFRGRPMAISRVRLVANVAQRGSCMQIAKKSATSLFALGQRLLKSARSVRRRCGGLLRCCVVQGLAGALIDGDAERTAVRRAGTRGAGMFTWDGVGGCSDPSCALWCVLWCALIQW